MSTVYFDLGKSLLANSSKANLDKMITQLKKSPYKTVVVNGFTDSVKGQPHSELSVARALTVKKYILAKTSNIKVSHSGKGLSATSKNVSKAMLVSRKADIWVG
jgi:outer membrane protein OmpA-like peptidoglycan-associated protein